jgi:nitrous oxidase accessory protein NosD
MAVRRSAAPLSVLLLLPSLALASPAAADGGTVQVHEGESIQAAVDAAAPGTRIHIREGTYTEAVVITKDGIELRGHDAVLEPPADGAPSPCDRSENPAEPAHLSGICIIGALEGESVTDPVTDVKVRGLTVRGAAGTGLIALGTDDLDVRRNHFVDNGGYGAASFATTGTRFLDNVATGNFEAGFYVGDSPDSNAMVRDNVSEDNELGFFFRNASHGVARDNHAVGNCAGILVLANAPGPATNWVIEDNAVIENNRTCTNVPVSGAGIVLLGAQDVHVEDNDVEGNRQADGSLAGGGIHVLTAFFIPGATPPSAVLEDNDLSGNTPADIVWDSTGELEVDENSCATSIPAGLCD